MPGSESAQYASGSPSATVRVARTREEVEQLRGVWSSWKGHRDADIDFCLDFVWAREEVIRPHVIVLYRDGKAEAMLVGRLERVSMRSKIGYLRLPGIPARLLNFSYGGALGDHSPTRASEFVRSVKDALRTGEADAALFDHIPVDGALYREVAASAGKATSDHLIRQELHCLMRVSGTIEEVYRRFSQGLRAEVRRKKRKAIADFGDSLKIERFFEWDALCGVLPKIEAVAGKTYQRGLGVGFQDNDYMHKRLRTYSDRGWLRVYLLSVAGEPQAFWIGTLCNGSFCSDYNGYDPRLRDYSLGTVLLAAMIEDFCSEQVAAVDFGLGQAEYKERFSSDRWMEAPVYLFAPTPKGISLNALRTAAGVADLSARKALERSKLAPKLKQIWRRRAARAVAAQAHGPSEP